MNTEAYEDLMDAALDDPAVVTAAQRWLENYADRGALLELSFDHVAAMDAGQIIGTLAHHHPGGLSAFLCHHAATTPLSPQVRAALGELGNLGETGTARDWPTPITIPLGGVNAVNVTVQGTQVRLTVTTATGARSAELSYDQNRALINALQQAAPDVFATQRTTWWAERDADGRGCECGATMFRGRQSGVLVWACRECGEVQPIEADTSKQCDDCGAHIKQMTEANYKYDRRLCQPCTDTMDGH